MKPLFIPLKTEWFNDFKCGAKSMEYRAYGPRWNERTCFIGRRAILSKGYSGERIDRVITGFSIIDPDRAPAEARAIFPGQRIAAISLDAI